MNIDTTAKAPEKIAQKSPKISKVVVPKNETPKKVIEDKVILSKEVQEITKKSENEAQKKLENTTNKSEITKKISGSRFINKPAIFFIGGFNFFSGSTNDGMKEMAEHVRGARFYNWDQKNEMVKEISKRPAHQPVVLVGHSLGGDTAVEIADELNSIDYNFKKVNLLVTLDSFGLKNDIIPQNVGKNMNFIGHKSIFLNDGPNIAKDANETLVINELRDEQHTELDDSEQIQYKILNEINKHLPTKESQLSKNPFKQ